jgi:hypothetical protein
MRLMLFALMPTVMLNACVYYEYSGDGEPDDFDWEDYLNGDGEDCLPCEEDDALVDADLQLAPDSAAAGDTFIATVSSGNGVDLAAVVDVVLDGPCEILAIDAGSDEVTIAIQVADDASSGAIDLWVAFADGTAAVLEGALEIQPADETGDDHETGDTCP